MTDTTTPIDAIREDLARRLREAEARVAELEAVLAIAEKISSKWCACVDYEEAWATMRAHRNALVVAVDAARKEGPR